MIDPSTLVPIAIVILTAAIVQGTVGFGFVLVAAPLMSILLEPRLVVPVILIQTLVTSAPILWHSYLFVGPRRIWVMMLSALVGVPAGTLLLVAVDASVLRVLIGAIVVVTALAMLAGYHWTLANERIASVPVGMASGVLGASTGLAGPPVIFFYTNQKVPSNEFRANIVAYFALIDLVILPVYLFSGVLTYEVATLSAQLIPASLAGVFAGIVVNRVVAAVQFRRIALGLMIFAGLSATVSGLAGLW